MRLLGRLLMTLQACLLGLPTGWCCASLPTEWKEEPPSCHPCCQHSCETRPEPEKPQPSRSCCCQPDQRVAPKPETPDDSLNGLNLPALGFVTLEPTSTTVVLGAPGIPSFRPPLHILHCLWLC